MTHLGSTSPVSNEVPAKCTTESILVPSKKSAFSASTTKATVADSTIVAPPPLGTIVANKNGSPATAKIEEESSIYIYNKQQVKEKVKCAIQEFTKGNNEEILNTLGDFLIDVALLTDANKNEDEDNNKVSLMTIHAAKGLEFTNVHVVGLEEDLFPSMLSKNSRSDMEEERRLFYVAVTRAKNNLTLSYAVSRFKWGNLIQCEPSRFLEELDPKYIEYPFVRKNNKKDFTNSISKNETTILKNKFIKPQSHLKKIKTLTSTSKKNEENDIIKLKVGNEVIHDRFGKGKVVDLNGEYPNTKATVFFPSSGQKQLLLKFAKLQLI